MCGGDPVTTRKNLNICRCVEVRNIPLSPNHPQARSIFSNLLLFYLPPPFLEAFQNNKNKTKKEKKNHSVRQRQGCGGPHITYFSTQVQYLMCFKVRFFFFLGKGGRRCFFFGFFFFSFFFFRLRYPLEWRLGATWHIQVYWPLEICISIQSSELFRAHINHRSIYISSGM